MRDPLVGEDEVQAALSGPLTAWGLLGGHLVRQVECRTFLEAIEFVTSVAEAAERADHHPDIDIRYRMVTLSLITHDSGGLTQRDLDLAEAIDAVASDYSVTR